MVPEITPAPDLPTRRPIDRPAVPTRAELNLPNLITLARLICVPLTVWLIFEQKYGFAFWVFVGAGLSDALDGYLAKRFDRRTRLGAMLDPAADKTLLAAVCVTLALAGQLPGWLVILVLLRDSLIVIGFFFIQATAAARQIDPLYISKVNTLVQLTLVGFVLAQGLGIESDAVKGALIAAATLTTVLSGLSYLARWARLLTNPERAL